MDLFISWSGEKSKSLALIFREWICNVIQTVKPWMSSEDIEKGDRWSAEIAGKLESCEIGVICITQENFRAPWINFEAGALSKRLGESKVCTILLDIKNTDIKGPLAQFQSTQVNNKDEIKKLLLSINKSQKEDRIEDSRLEKVFEVWWPIFEEQVNKIKVNTSPIEPVSRTDKELLEEALSLMRTVDKRVRALENHQRSIDSHRVMNSIIRQSIQNTNQDYKVKNDEIIQQRIIDNLSALYNTIEPGKRIEITNDGIKSIETLGDGTVIAKPILLGKAILGDQKKMLDEAT